MPSANSIYITLLLIPIPPSKYIQIHTTQTDIVNSKTTLLGKNLKMSEQPNPPANPPPPPYTPADGAAYIYPIFTQNRVLSLLRWRTVANAQIRDLHVAANEQNDWNVRQREHVDRIANRVQVLENTVVRQSNEYLILQEQNGRLERRVRALEFSMGVYAFLTGMSMFWCCRVSWRGFARWFSLE